MYKTYKEYLESEKQDLLTFLRSKIVIDHDHRVDWSSKYLRWKKILNVGCLNHDLASYNQQHASIVALGSFVLWVDIIWDARKVGDNILIGDITKQETIDTILGKHGKFDVVFAGEIIEHLDNYLVFFERIHGLLNEDWIVVCSTPNPFGLHYFLQQILKGYLIMWNTDHKTWIDPVLLSFNLRNLFTFEDAVWVDNTKCTEYKICKIFHIQQVSANYQVVFKKWIK